MEIAVRTLVLQQANRGQILMDSLRESADYLVELHRAQPKTVLHVVAKNHRTGERLAVQLRNQLDVRISVVGLDRWGRDVRIGIHAPRDLQEAPICSNDRVRSSALRWRWQSSVALACGPAAVRAVLPPDGPAAQPVNGEPAAVCGLVILRDQPPKADVRVQMVQLPHAPGPNCSSALQSKRRHIWQNDRLNGWLAEAAKCFAEPNRSGLKRLGLQHLCSRAGIGMPADGSHLSGSAQSMPASLSDDFHGASIVAELLGIRLGLMTSQ